MQDVLLHETAVAIFRQHMRKEKPRVAPWKETIEMWQARADGVVRWMNSERDPAKSLPAMAQASI